MIRMITENDIATLKPYGRNDVFLSRILSAYAAYGSASMADFWVQTEEGRLNAVLSRVDDVLTLAYISGGNQDELEGFLYAIDASVILCSAEFAERQYPGQAVTGPILHYDNSVILECEFAFDRNPPLQEQHRVMQKCKSETFRVPEWEPFYLDMSHRIRHNCALSVGLRNDKQKLVACGFTVAQTEHNAMLGGICVLPDHRRRGYGKMVVAALLSLLPQKDIYVFRNAEENKSFYEMIGFTECGTWAELRRPAGAR